MVLPVRDSEGSSRWDGYNVGGETVRRRVLPTAKQNRQFPGRYKVAGTIWRILVLLSQLNTAQFTLDTPGTSCERRVAVRKTHISC